MEVFPVTADPVTPPKQSPYLEYPIYLPRAGEIEIGIVIAPTQKLLPDRGLRLAVSIDDNTPQTIDGAEASESIKAKDYARIIADNAQTLTFKQTIRQPGRHTLKVWMVDPDIALEYIVVGAPRPSYFGPPAATVGPSY